MKKNIWKNISILFFLSTFLFLRIGNFHVFSHISDDGDDQVHCELCEIIALSNDLTPFTNDVFEAVVQKPEIDISRYKTNFCYELSNYSITLPESIYNKPPPGFIG
ncbi:hypothetical protein [Aquimarina sp. RZ0]|uniref:hypothetical protein n=1 Tax=Aquimarina sp. RZ0 TaxID=2607730 RepID=UPI0011F33ACC|nr:hypothetical protein [Aquimarina sp. RZ0]KAA1247899.1 hypothetical protein F0000_01385 [Aquimarina sp. RZ0]